MASNQASDQFIVWRHFPFATQEICDSPDLHKQFLCKETVIRNIQSESTNIEFKNHWLHVKPF